ncbi:MAG TPA: chemotaxis protein CheA [Gemmatimonadales bacterium]|nr:chemotaxis protein CheA [Gemmatimonadales bacterium]
MDLNKYAALFLAESREHLTTCNRLLLDWEREPGSPEPVAGLFRAIHSLKGMAATMGYARLADLAHRTEHLLDSIRGGRAPGGPAVVDLLLKAVDALERGVEEAASGADGAFDPGEVPAALAAAAEAEVSKAAPAKKGGARKGRKQGAAPAEPSIPAPKPVPVPVVAVAEDGGRVVRVEIRADAALPGARAHLALKRAERLGKISGVMPPTSAFDVQGFDGRFTFRLDAPLGESEIVAAIEAAGEIASVSVDADAAQTAEWRIPTASAPAAVAAPTARTGQIRVDRRRLDALMSQVGELVVARNRLLELAQREPGGELEALGARISRLVSDLQTEIIEARMTPVWQVFDRFPRAVRDLSRQLGKQIRFEMEGEGIELDRAILDELGDPLLHLLRNAVDHGLEPPEERTRRGKPAEGRLVLSAARERSTVAIRIQDDGRGIDRKAVLAKAQREGVVGAEVESLSDDLLLKVLGRPGFSTADRVSSVSGRGVGIDVVLTRVRAHGGAVEISSTPGAGTTFTMRLPLTLAILRVLTARVGSERYLLPLSYVAETVDFDTQPATEVKGREAIVLRDRIIPTVHLRSLLGVEAGEVPARRPGLVLEVGDRRSAVVVDALMGQQEVVVEPFDAPAGTAPLFSGATILADGTPALILDAAALV